MITNLEMELKKEYDCREIKAMNASIFKNPEILEEIKAIIDYHTIKNQNLAYKVALHEAMTCTLSCDDWED